MVGLYLYFTHPSRIVSMAESTLARITGAHVEIDGAHFEFNGPITLYGVHMRVPNVPGQPDGGDRLFDCESVVIEHRLSALLTGGLDIQSVQFRRPILYPTEHVDEGKFTLQFLEPEKKKDRKKKDKKDRSRHLPDVRIQGAHIVFGEIKDGRYQVLQSIRLNADLMRQSELDDDYRFALTRSKTGGEQPVQITGLFNLVEESMSAEVELGEITQDDSRVKLLPRNVRQVIEQLKPSGNLSLIRFGYNADSNVTAELTFENGSMEVPWGETVLPVDQTTGTLTISDDERIDVDLKGRARGSTYDAAYTVKGSAYGLNMDAPFDVSVTLAGQVTDKPEDMELLPGPLRFLFSRYGPQGHYEINAHASRGTDGEQFVTSGTLRLIDGSIRYEHVPYPLENVTANIRFDADHVAIDGVMGVGPPDEFGRRARIKIAGQVIAPGRRSGVHVDITIDGMPLNDDLFSSLQPHERKAITAFFDRGAYVRMTAEDGGVIQSTRQKKRRQALIAELESRIATLVEQGEEGSPDVVVFRGRVADLKSMVRRPVFDLGGTADLLVQLRRAPGDPRIRTTLTAESDGVFAMYEHWPYPLKVKAGKIVVDTLAPRVDAMGLVAESVGGGGTFALDGRLLPPKEGSRLMSPDIDIVAKDMPVDGVLFSVIPEQYAQWLRDLRFNGQWSANGKIDQAADGTIDYNFDVQFDKAMLKPWGGDYDLNQVRGGLRIDRKGLAIDQVTARHGDSTLIFKATTGQPGAAGLTLIGKNIQLDDPIYELLPPDSNQYLELKKLFDDHKPAGVFDFEVTRAAQSATDETYRVILSPKQLAFTLKDQLIDLKNVSGDVIASDRSIAFRQLAAEFGAGRFDVNGSLSTGDAFRCELLFNVAAKEICPVAKTVLPDAVIKAIAAIELDGPYELKQASLAVDHREGASRPLSFKGSLALKDAKAKLGVDVKELAGRIDINAIQNKGDAQPGLKLDISNASMRAGDRKVEALTAKLATTDKPGLIKVTDLKGKSYGGSVIGEGFVQAGDDDTTYRLTLSFQEVALEPFLKPLDPKYLNFKVQKDDNQTTKRNRVAVLSASLTLEGKTGDTSSRRGRGNMSVADASLYETPVGFAVLQLLNLSLPSAKSFDRMQATYLIDGDIVRFDKLAFLSNALTISGTGTMKYSTQELDLTLVSANPSGIKLGPLTDVLNMLKDELISLRVTGTLSEPKSGIQSLKGLRNSVDDVLGEPKNKKPEQGTRIIQPQQ